MSTPNLDLEQVPSNSLQPSIPINDALQVLDAVVQLSVEAITATPPTTIAGDAGRRWIVAAGATGAWSGHDSEIALSTGANLWRFIVPQIGFAAYNRDDQINYQAVESSGAMDWEPFAGAGGGVESVVAGTGITVDNTDPQHPIVSTSGSGGLTNWTETLSTSAPNATVPAATFDATNAAANVDAVLRPKGTGALTSRLANNAASGGNKRGTDAVDFQRQGTTAAKVASGQQSVISGGYDNEATGVRSCVPGGSGNSASGQNSFAAGLGAIASNTQAVAFNGTASGPASVSCGGTASGTSSLSGGDGTVASGNYSVATGRSSSTRGIIGAHARASNSNNGAGGYQGCSYVLSVNTTNNTTTALTTNGAAAGSTNQIVMPTTSAYAFHGRFVARDTSSGDAAAWEVKGAVKRIAGTLSLVGTPTVTALGADAGAAAWTLAVTTDATNGALRLNATGENSKTIRWCGEVDTAEVV